MKHIVLTIILILPMAMLKASEATTVSQWVDLQNQVRRQLGLKPLQWDTKLATYAQKYGTKRRVDCALIHSNGPYGENLFWGSGTQWGPPQAVSGWISERRSYNRASNSCLRGDCGHYTQIVWRGTTKVGCARVVCNGGAGVLFVCEYDPPGNFSQERPY